MASSKPTKREADDFVAAVKIITASVSWKSERGSWRLEAKALEPERQIFFRLVGYIGRDNHSFALLYRNYPIRRFTKHQKHKYKGEIIRVPHKHVWDEVNEGAEVYIPEDIDPGDNINDQFLDFCKECNIKLRGGYQPVAYELMR